MAIKTALGAKRYNDRMDKISETAKKSKAAHEDKVKEFGKVKDVNKAAKAFKEYQSPAAHRALEAKK